MTLPPGNFGRPRIGDQRRQRYNVVLDPTLQEDAKGAAELIGDSFSKWMEEAARNRLKFDKNDLSALNLHGVGEIHMPRIGYDGGGVFAFPLRPKAILVSGRTLHFGSRVGFGISQRDPQSRGPEL